MEKANEAKMDSFLNKNLEIGISSEILLYSIH